MSVRPIPRLEIRHLERQEDTTHDTIIQSATRLAGQACTNQSKFQSEIRWLQPFARPLTSIGITSSAYAFREPPPTRESLLRTLPSVSSSCSLTLLDWGTPFTESESLGLLGLEDFTSGIDWSVRRPVIARPVHSLAKRRRSTEESDYLGDSNLPKRKRFPILNPASIGGPAIPTLTSASRFHELTTQRGTARIRLGLQKRLGIGQAKSSGASNHVKMTPKRQLGPGPSRILDSEEEPLDSSVTAFSKPGDTFSVQPPNQAVQPLLPTPKTTSLKSTMLVPSTPSSIARRTTAPPVCGGDSRITSRMAASVSYDSSPDCSSDRISRSQIPTSQPSSDDDLSENDSRPQLIPVSRLSNNGLSSVLGSILVSTEKKVLKEPPGQADNTEEHTAKDLGQATQLVASVMYDSSQGSTASHSEETSKLHTTYGTLALPSSFDKDFSSQKTNGSGSWDISDLPPTNSRALIVPDPILPPSSRIDQTRVVAILEKAREDRGQSGPEERATGLSMLSALYGSSQGDPILLGSQPDHPSPQEPVPSWSTYKSSQNGTPRPLSGAQPSSSWSIPSVEGLVAASRSLSLDDFENQVRRPSSRGSPASNKNLLSKESLSHSQMEENLIKSIPHAPHLMHPEVSRLASYVSTEDSICSPTPSLPKPSNRTVDDDSIESINSPLPKRTRSNVGSHRVPAFRLPGPELEDDISFESQQAHKQKPLSPTRLGNPDSSPEMIDSSASDQKTSVPRFDALPSPDGRSPQAGSTAETEIARAHQPSPPVVLSAPNRHAVLNHPTLGLVATITPPYSKTYKGSLHNIILQPHFLPSLPCPSPSLTEGMLAALEVAKVHAWFDEQGKPKPAPSEGFTREPWKRAAWIIPVRGRPPWEGCSSAAISSRPIVKAKKKRTILWTPGALRSLWTQLDGFRESKRVGSLSISFEPAQTDQAFEFVKVYHEAKVSLKLRTILKVLEFPDCDGYGVNAEIPQEDEGGLGGTRRLLGSSTRLALLDEVGRIVLFS